MGHATIGLALRRASPSEDGMEFDGACKASEGTVSGSMGPVDEFLRRLGWVVLELVGVAETTCCLQEAARSSFRHFRCPIDLAEGGICQFETDILNSLSGNLRVSCVEGGVSRRDIGSLAVLGKIHATLRPGIPVQRDKY